MSDTYQITHRTTYRYAEPVRFGVHRVLFRPRDSHDQRVLATDLQVSPRAEVRLIQDPHSNSVALVQPLGAAALLEIACSFTIEHVHTQGAEPPMEPSALTSSTTCARTTPTRKASSTAGRASSSRPAATPSPA
jgi:hypothetical protein